MKYPDAELLLPVLDEEMSGKWCVEAKGPIEGYYQYLRADFSGLDIPMEESQNHLFLFDTEYDAHVAAAAFYHDTGRNYPYRKEWRDCAPEFHKDKIWVPDVESQVMEFE